MTVSAMGKKCVVLGLAIFLLLSSFQKLSGQVDGGRDLRKFDMSTDHRKYQANVQEKDEEEESHSIKRESESQSSFKNTTVTARKEISMSLSDGTEAGVEDSLDADNSSQSESVSGRHEVGRRSSMMDEIDREIEAHLGSLNKQAVSGGVHKVGDADENDADRRIQLVEEMWRQMEAAAATRFEVDEGNTKRKRTLETHEFKFEGDESADGESRKYQMYFGKMGEDEESAKGPQEITNAQKTESQYNATSTESQQSSTGSSSTGNILKKGNGGSGMLGSFGISQSGVWRCVSKNENGVIEETEDASIVIPQYNINDIIREETYEGSETSSLVDSLTHIIEKHRKEIWSLKVTDGSSETVENLKTTLKKYRAISARELVTRSDFEEILTMAARYEELSSASVSYISRLSMYRSVIKEGIKASQRAQLAHARAKLLKDMALERQKNVDVELDSVKALAQRGDMLHVKIFAITKLVSKLEAERKEVDTKFQKIIGNLSGVLQEASQAYEEYHMVVRKWKEEQAAEEFSRESIERAEVVWVKFLSTL